MPIDYTNPKIIKFMDERLAKELRTRVSWNEKNLEKIQLSAQFNKKPHNYFEEDVLSHSMSAGLAVISREHATAGYNRKKVPLRDAKTITCLKDIRRHHPIVDIGLGDPKDDPRLVKPETDLSPDPIMRAVDPDVEEVIHKSIPEYGRLKYLKLRNNKSPDKKYYFPETIYWDYGWKIEEKNIPRATHGSCSILLNLLKKNRVGPQPDPPHYRQPVTGPYTKCVKE